MATRGARFDNRITRLLGVDVPIANSPMGFVAKPDLVAAVAMAGGIGLVPGSMGIDGAREDIKRVRDMTDRPIGVNLPIAYVRDPSIADMLVEEHIPFVTTSAGSPKAYTPVLKAAGITVLHVVTSLDTAKKAVDAGVDGLVVEGIEGAGLKGNTEVASSVLLPLLAHKLDVPLIAAGGIADGMSMAAAFALGAEGVQMGTRMLASVESNVHDGHRRELAPVDRSGGGPHRRLAAGRRDHAPDGRGVRRDDPAARGALPPGDSVVDRHGRGLRARRRRTPRAGNRGRQRSSLRPSRRS
jgi:enoyl-[acyl-carrier protein] reductase II